MRAILLAAFAFFILASPAFAGFDALGAQGNDASGTDFIGQGTGNIQNWPQKALEVCKKAQDNAVQACQDYVRRLNLNPGGWWVDRMISAKSFLPRSPPIDVNIQDHIVGKFDCPPHGLIVDSEGHLVLQSAIYAETVNYGKSTQRKGKYFPGGDESIEISCSFSCHAWPCAEGTDEFRNCDETPFTDKNGDGFSDGKRDPDGGGWGGRTKGEVVERLTNGEPNQAGGYYSGLRVNCEGEEKIPWWKFWKDKNCKLKDCISTEIPYRGSREFGTSLTDTIIIRVCCGCTCSNRYMIPNFRNNTYVPLGYDPWVKILNPEPIETTVRNDVDALIGTFNTLPRLPAGIKNIFGDESVDVNIVDPAKKNLISFGVQLVDGKVSGAKIGSLGRAATMSVNTDHSTFYRIKDSKDPAGILVKSINDKSIKYSSVGVGGAVKVGLVNLAAGVLGGQTPTVRTGSQVVINGQTGVVKVNPNNVFVVQYTTPQREMPVVNSYANVYGYTYQRPQNLVSTTPKSYSSNAGIYPYTTNTYSNYWTTQSYRPSVPTVGSSYSARTSMQTAYAGYSYAGRGGFGGSSGATYSTIGFRA